jgi:hypothetical protein
LAEKVVADAKIAENLAKKTIDPTKPLSKTVKEPLGPILANPATPNSTETITAALLANKATTTPNPTEVAPPTVLGDLTIPNPTEAVTAAILPDTKLATQQEAKTPAQNVQGQPPANLLPSPQSGKPLPVAIAAQPIAPSSDAKNETLTAEEIKTIISEAVKDEITEDDSVSSEDLHKIISEEINAMDPAKFDSGSDSDAKLKESENFDLEQLKTIMASEIKTFMDKEKSDRKKEVDSLEKRHEKAIDAQKTSLDKKIKSQEEALKATTAKNSKANQDRLDKARAETEAALKHKKNLELSLETLSNSKKKLERLKRITKLHLEKIAETISKLEKPETSTHSSLPDQNLPHLLGLRQRKLLLMTSLEKLDRSLTQKTQSIHLKTATLKKLLPPSQFSLYISQNSPKNRLKPRLTKLLTFKFQIFRLKKKNTKKLELLDTA